MELVRTSTENTILDRETRRNYMFGIFNGIAFRTAEALIDPPVVLTWFVSQLTSSNLLAGLVAPLGDACWFLPQIFVSVRVQRMERKMPYYALSAVVRIVVWLFLAATVWMVDDPLILLIGFFVLYTIARMSAGLAGIAFFDVVAKTIPARRRGSFFTTRQFLGGALGVGAGWVVKSVLSHPALPFPHGHAFLFSLYCVMIVPALASFTLVREPPGTAIPGPVTLGTQLRRAKRLLRQHPVYRRYMATRIALALANIALPFYSIYAKNVLAAPDGLVGVYVATGVGALLLFNLPWGWVSDRRGNRLVMRLLLLGKGLTVLLALALVGLVALLGYQKAWLPYLALPLFFLEGAVKPAYMLIGSNFLLELVPEAERPLYLGSSSTLMGVIVLMSGMGGVIVDLLGFASLFAVSLGLCLVGYVLALGLPEPRETTA
jgi:hypothetical protein